MDNKPDMIQGIGITMIVSGAINILWGIGVSFTLILTLLGILCLPLGLIPIGVGIYELIQGIHILNQRPVKTIPLIGGLEIASLLWGNILSMVAGILVLVFYNDPEVKAYFESMI